MKSLLKLTLAASFVLASATAAFADPVTGSITIGGTDTFNSTSINFNPSTAAVLSATGTLAQYAPSANPATGQTTNFLASLTSFSFANASGVNLFHITFGGLSFTITQLLTNIFSTTATGNSLTLAGTGLFTEAGYDNTVGTFSLTTSNTGAITSFQINSMAQAVTPEPSSLILLGTGLVGAAALMFSRRRRFSM